MWQPPRLICRGPDPLGDLRRHAAEAAQLRGGLAHRHRSGGRRLEAGDVELDGDAAGGRLGRRRLLREHWGGEHGDCGERAREQRPGDDGMTHCDLLRRSGWRRVTTQDTAFRNVGSATTSASDPAVLDDVTGR
jgi:hypothetical protein